MAGYIQDLPTQGAGAPAGLVPQGPQGPQDLTAQGAAAPAGLLQQAQNQEAGYVNSAPTGYQAPITRDTFVLPKGANMSYVEGVRKAMDDQRADIATNNQSAMVGIQQETQGWGRTDREKKRSIDDGMVQASRTGGYAGVIDYLQTSDPDRALQFSTAKNTLDQGMLQTDVMKVLAPNEQAKALAEGYGILGKMGAAIMKAPVGDREAMYQNMMPVIKKINPDAPDNVAAATPMFMLGIAQATPANILFDSTKTALQAQSTIGKLESDRQKYVSLGYASDSPQVKNINTAIQEENDKSQQAHLRLAETQSSIAANATTKQKQVMDSTESFSKNLENGSKDFNTFMSTYGNVSAAIETLKQNPNDTYAQNMLSRSYAMGLNKGAFSESDAAVGMSATGWAAWKKKLNGYVSGTGEVLNPTEVKMMINTYDTMMEKKLTQQLSYESQYQNSANKAGPGLVNWEGVRLPSKQYYALKMDNSSVAGAKTGSNAIASAIADTVRNPALIPQFVQKYGYNPAAPRQQPQQQGQGQPPALQGGQ